MRKLYGVLLVALGLLLGLRLANGSSMLQLAGVLLVLAGLAVALLRHADDSPAAEPAVAPDTAGSGAAAELETEPEA